MNKPINIWNAYKCGWLLAKRYYKAILIVYSINLLLALMAICPVSKVLNKAFSHSLLQNKLTEGFDYTLIMEVLRKYNIGIDVSLSILMSIIFIYLLWSIFYTGGFIGLMRNSYQSSAGGKDSSMDTFWQSGSRYFFRCLRLTIYVIAILCTCTGLIGYILFYGVSPFTMFSEGPIIVKFYLFLSICTLLLFLISIFKDLAKIYIVKEDTSSIYQTNRKAINKTVTKSSLKLGILNISLLLLACLIYFLAKTLLGNYIIPAFIVGQIFILYRITYKFVKLGSFWTLIHS